MVEVVGWVVSHTNPLHDTSRSNIAGHGKRHDLFKLQCMNAKLQRSAGAFGGKPPAPIVGRKAPPNFDAGREVRLKVWNRQADKSSKRRNASNLDGPEAKAVLIEVCFYPQRERVTVFTPQERGQMLHHAPIGIKCRERFAIGWTPPPQTKTRGFELGVQATFARIFDMPRATSALQSGRLRIA